MAGADRDRVALRAGVSTPADPASEGKRTTAVMPEHASRIPGALYDQQNEDRIADWGGDDLFTRMPRPRAVDDAPAPRFRPALVLVEPDEPRAQPAEPDVPRAQPDEPRAQPLERDEPAAEPETPRSERAERRRTMSAEEAMHERAERLGLTLVPSADEPAVPGADSPWDPAAWNDATHATVRAWDGDYGDADRAPNGRRTKVITGRPDPAPRPLSLVPAERRRPARTPAEWVGAKPERIVAWAFVLGLLLILIAISTADAATL